MRITGHPRTEPYVRLSRIRLPPWVFDGEALVWPGMKDARFGEPVVGQLSDPLPCHPVLLAAPPKRPPPEIDDMIPEGPECRTVGRHRVVLEVAGDDLFEPFRRFADRLMHSPSELLLDLREFRLHAVASAPPMDQELALAGLAADEGEAQEVEGFRLAEPAPLAVRRRMTAELDEPGFVRMERQREFRKPRAHRLEEPTCVGLMLETDHQIIGIAHDDHVAGGLAPSPALGPEIENIVQVDVREQR